MTPFDIPCPHVDHRGFKCGAEPGCPCVNLDLSGKWIRVRGFHGERIQAQPISTHTLDELTPREVLHLSLIIDGHNQESVARRMEISINTVNRNQHNILRKLEVNSTAEVIAWYYHLHWRPKVAE